MVKVGQQGRVDLMVARHTSSSWDALQALHPLNYTALLYHSSPEQGHIELIG